MATGVCASSWFLFGSLNPALKCGYVLEAQEKDLSTSDTIRRVDTFRKHVDFLPRIYPNKIVHPGPPSSEELLVPGAFDIDCGVLECAGDPSLSTQELNPSFHVLPYCTNPQSPLLKCHTQFLFLGSAYPSGCSISISSLKVL